MANYIWPPALPQVPQRGFSESVGANIIRTPTDQGPAKQRRRSLRPSTMGVSFLMTTAQVAILQDFLYDTLQGVKAFDFTHPRTGYAVNTRVVPGQDGELFKSTYAAPGYWTITLNFEILPTFTTLSPGSYNIPISRISQFSRTTTATYIDQSGVLQTAPANTARYQGGQLLVEGGATNLLQRAAFADAYWGKTGVSVASGFSGPDLGFSAFSVTATSGAASTHRLQRTSGIATLSAGDYVWFSVFVKDGFGLHSVILNIGDTEAGSGSDARYTFSSDTFVASAGTAQGVAVMETLASGWRRLSYGFQAIASDVLDVYVVLSQGAVVTATWVGDDSANCLLFGPQVIVYPAGTARPVTPPSYIPTTTTAVTRAADLAIISAT